jgi:hypothetical protein
MEVDGQAGEQAPRVEEQYKRSPADFLKTALGRPVTVKLNSGIEYKGKAPFFPPVVLPWIAGGSIACLFGLSPLQVY